MKKLNLIIALLVLIFAMNACDESSQELENTDSLSGEFKANFQNEDGITGVETIQLKSDSQRTFTSTYQADTKTETSNGTYTYSAQNNTGMLHHVNGDSQAFTCSGDTLLHVGNTQYCSQTQGGHHNSFDHDSSQHQHGSGQHGTGQHGSGTHH